MHWTLFVFKPKGHVVDKDKLFDAFSNGTDSEADYIGDELTDKIGEKDMTKIKLSVTDVDKAIDYAESVKDKIKELLDDYNPYALKGKKRTDVDDDTKYGIEEFTYRLKELNGFYFAIIYDDGEIVFYRHFDLANRRIAQGYQPVKDDMELVAYDYHC